MKEYTDHRHENAFIDFPKRLPTAAFSHECSKCQGHGGWNLRINAYKLPEGKEDTPENRHRYVHFRAQCENCYGWGYVSPKQGDHIHEWKWVRKVGNCLNEYKCAGCGETQQVDSSD